MDKSANQTMKDLGYAKYYKIDSNGFKKHCFDNGLHVLEFGNVQDLWDYLDSLK